jgi:hypothetical protein
VLQPDGETGIIDQVQERQVEGVADIQVAGELVAAIRRQPHR